MKRVSASIRRMNITGFPIGDMIFESRPADFKPRFHVVSCFLLSDGQFLLLHRPEHKSQGGKWGVPGGKVDADETEIAAMVRELGEETGINIDPENIHHFNTIYVRYPDHDFVYSMFSADFPERPEVRLNPAEHQDFRWTTPQEALGMNLIDDEDACIKMFFRI